MVSHWRRDGWGDDATGAEQFDVDVCEPCEPCEPTPSRKPPPDHCPNVWKMIHTVRRPLAACRPRRLRHRHMCQRIDY